MKINFTATITGLDGVVAKNSDGADLTLRDVAVSALLGDITGRDGRPEPRDPKTKFEHARLAERLYLADEVDLSVDDVALIKQRIGAVWSPLVVMRAWDIIEPAPSPE